MLNNSVYFSIKIDYTKSMRLDGIGVTPYPHEGRGFPLPANRRKEPSGFDYPLEVRIILYCVTVGVPGYRSIPVPRGMSLDKLEAFKKYCIEKTKKARNNYKVICISLYMIRKKGKYKFQTETELPLNVFFL
jgi:hypothetical protein